MEITGSVKKEIVLSDIHKQHNFENEFKILVLCTIWLEEIESISRVIIYKHNNHNISIYIVS